LKKFKGEIVIWSGGGSTYAEKVARMVLPRGMDFTARTKVDVNVRDFVAGDIVIDDQYGCYAALKEYGVRVFNPFEEWEEVKEKK